MLAWAISPAIAYMGIIFLEMLTRPAVDNPLGKAFFGFMLVASIGAIPWLICCAIGFAIGRTIRRRFLLAENMGTPPPAATAKAVVASKVATTEKPPARIIPRVVEMAGWRNVHIGFRDDGLRIGGMDVWGQDWRRVDAPSLQLPHPIYPAQIHRYDIYEIGDMVPPVRFAVGELSNGVWGFYVPTTDPLDSAGITADGSLRYEHRISANASDRYDTASTWAVLIDAATGLVLVDCAGWASSRIAGNPDGSLFLHLQQNYVDVLFRIDPALRQFCNWGEGGPARPLADLSDAVEQARRANGQSASVPVYRRISPDGAIRVDLASVEWGNSLWVNSPRVTALPGGEVVLDLWGTDWDAAASFPVNRCVRLDLRRFHEGGNLTVDLDLRRGTYQIIAEPGQDGPGSPAPLADIVSGLDASARRSAAYAVLHRGGHGPHGGHIRPHPLAAWRQAIVILLGALVAIAAATFISLHFFPAKVENPWPLQTVPTLTIPPSQ
jgi:hypothetical protein